MHKNNFDFLRLLFATFVIITHSYALTGKAECDWLCQITAGQLKFSEIGLYGFFIISGYLIYQSLNRSKNLIDFYWKRLLRLYPGLIAVLTLTVILSPLVYENTRVGFLSNRDVWTYVPKNLTLYKIQYTISGVFENNPYKGVINGSIWSIPYEFTMYILLSALFYFKNQVRFTQIILIVSFSIFIVCNVVFIGFLGKYSYILSGKYLLDLGVYFIGGAVLAAIRLEKSKSKDLILFLSILLFVISLVLKFSNSTNYVLLPLIVICFGLKSTPLLNNISSKIGDLSYGMYIYGFLVQQTIVHFFRTNTPELMVSSLIISSFLAYLSWHLIESPALKLKSKQPAAHFRNLISTIKNIKPISKA